MSHLGYYHEGYSRVALGSLTMAPAVFVESPSRIAGASRGMSYGPVGLSNEHVQPIRFVC